MAVNSPAPASSLEKWASALRLAGGFLSLLAIAFIGWRVAASAKALQGELLAPSFLIAIGLTAAAYAALSMVMALAWHVLLSTAGAIPLTAGDTLTIFGRAQFLKYLPSNVLHYVGRHTAAHGKGIPHRTLLWSTFAETTLMVVAAALVAAMFTPVSIVTAIDQVQLPSWTRLLLLGVAASAFVVIAGAQLRKAPDMRAEALAHVKAAAIAFLLYLLFFLANGCLLIWLATSLHQTIPPSPFALIGLVSLAWIAGFVVPGAPAGLGVRDLLLAIGLEHAGLGQSALAITLGYRIATLSGDALFAAFAHLRH